MHSTKVLRTAAALVCATLLASPALSNDAFPQKPVKVIVPYGAGGASDLIARKVGEGLSRMWKQPVVVENRAGGNTVTGSEFVVKSAPDGYTLLWTSNAHVILPSLYERLPYDWT
ncbi:MAG: tripartite tricarboxylate transporter substrate-binding protein, partial [Caldisericota bacterium]|nr:tripartite tricarboxylate transporter substrate-binding protein [Caldisericota bacterium]